MRAIAAALNAPDDPIYVVNTPFMRSRPVTTAVANPPKETAMSPRSPRTRDQRQGHRLPAERGAASLLRSPLGALVARPWFDRFATWMLAKWFFPLSRLWAAARAAEGSPERFFEAVPLAPDPARRARLMKALGKFEAARASVNALEAEWRRVFFGEEEVGSDYLVAVESARRDRRTAYNATRRHFLFLTRRNAVPMIRFEVPTPEAVEAIHGPHLADPKKAFAPPKPMPPVAVSRKVPAHVGSQFWLRFPSPSERTNDVVYARVHEPEGVENPPTLIFGHGICVEFDHWHGLIDEVEAICAMGIRVVRPEAPWHGRRVLPGQFGGEHLIAASPLGMLDLFTTALAEWSVLMDWCRRTTKGPVAMGGSSLGALISQLAADRARDWPAKLRPDALFLITHCGKHEDAALRGRLARVWEIGAAAAAKGWTPELLARYHALLDPLGEPVVAPENIVTVLGSRDDVTPYDSGKELIERWRVPEENQFIWNRGHFSVPLTLMRDHRPLRRFKAILDQVS
jgi:hypothetical protein